MTATDEAYVARYGELLARYDRLGLALSRMEDLEGFVLVLKNLDVLAVVDLNHPAAASAIDRSLAFQALADVAEEVLHLKTEAQDGRT